MTKKFKVWCPADGDGPEDARTITAFDAEEAAEFWAERDDAESAEYQIASGLTLPVVVVEASDGSLSQFRVSGEAVPTYSAHLEQSPPETATSGENISPEFHPDNGPQGTDFLK